MTFKQASNIALAVASAGALSGCVAAAIPLVAGGAVLGASTDGIDAGADRSPSATSEAPTLAQAPNPVQQAEPETPAIASSAAATGTLIVSDAPKTARIAAAPASTPASLSAVQTSDAAVASTTDLDPFAAFFRYTREQTPAQFGAVDPDEEPPISAVLKDPVALDGERKECETKDPIVLVDLDPQGSRYAPGASFLVDPQFALGLRDLRSSGVKIAWLSSASAAVASDLHNALRASGLDMVGRDKLLLMRSPDDRKQKRLEEVSSTSCVLAIIGDERSDFDERFKYLKNPDDARSLDALIGKGWFLAPSLIAPEAE